MKKPLSPRDIHALAWRPQRIYRSRLEAWPTHYPEWWEAPQRQRIGARALSLVLSFTFGMACGVLAAL